jgi:diphthamide synthase (EF-2-diphthine--ammonia ligase)
VVSGDIAEVGGQPNFINAPAERAGLQLELPLWGIDRHEHLETIIALGFDVLLTYVNEPWLGPEWIGRRLDRQAFAELSALGRDRGLDVAGENGEYHSMVLGGPGWHHALRVEGRTVSAPPAHRLQNNADQRARRNALMLASNALERHQAQLRPPLSRSGQSRCVSESSARGT